MKTQRDLSEQEREQIAFAVCQRFVKEKQNAGEIAAALSRQWGMKFTREQMYPRLREGFQRKFIRLWPPERASLAQRLADRYAADVNRIHIVPMSTTEHVASVAARVVLGLIQDLAAKKEAVHLALGAGWTTMRVARHLASLMQKGFEDITLVLHALSATFDVEDPMRSPVAFFTFFQEVRARVRYVGLFAPGAVGWDQYEDVKGWPGVKEAFEKAGEIDIVISSLGNVYHEDSALNRLLKLTPEALNDLRSHGVVGDLQGNLFSATGPFHAQGGYRVMSLFDLSELREMAHTQSHKHVVLVAMPCGKCGASKAEALQPLLKEPALRVWNHLVTDLQTAQDLLDPTPRDPSPAQSPVAAEPRERSGEREAPRGDRAPEHPPVTHQGHGPGEGSDATPRSEVSGGDGPRGDRKRNGRGRGSGSGNRSEGQPQRGRRRRR